ncbi:MAG: hypothetical protein OEU54_13990, partial [Gemmatimonadota bacterium]|nr:hypothetical protein [Gemmatimonadota bacterium]
DAASDSSSDDDSDDDCEFEVGPFLLELPLDGTTETQIQLDDVRPGRYDELEFDIHKPDDDTAGDLDFIAVHPDFRDVSIRVEGTYNGQSFLYLTDLNEEQEIDLVPPIVVGGGETVQVTLALDVGGWFRRGDGSLVDPATANKGGPNEDLVEDNIESSIELEDDEDDD